MALTLSLCTPFSPKFSAGQSEPLGFAFGRELRRAGSSLLPNKDRSAVQMQGRDTTPCSGGARSFVRLLRSRSRSAQWGSLPRKYANGSQPKAQPEGRNSMPKKDPLKNAPKTKGTDFSVYLWPGSDFGSTGERGFHRLRRAEFYRGL